MDHPLSSVFARCEHEAMSYCLLRDADAIDLAGGGEVDLLVDPVHLTVLTAALTDAGFVRLESWGRSPHRFFIRYDAVEDRWIKCDVVTAVAFGRPVHNLGTALAKDCLAHRRRAGGTFGPGIEEELITLLLHEMLDKKEFRPHRIARLKWLRGQVTHEDRLGGHLARYWPSMTWATLAEAIDRDAWPGLLSQSRAVARAIARRAPVQTALRGVRDRAYRTLFRLAGLARPTAPSLALLAPDGAGKSTLAAGITSRFFGPVCSVYMGLYQAKSGSVPRRIAGLGLVTSLLTQWRRYGRARYRQACGQLVLFDRYSYDALLPGRRRLNPVRRVRRWLLAWTVPAPDLIVVLDAPGSMLYARKGEHSVDLLERQRQSYLDVSRRLPRVTVVDAQRGPDQVRRTVTALIWDAYRHGRGSPRA